jgi:hypothetical protein
MINNVFQVNIRSGPGTGNEVVGKAATGQTGLVVLDVQPDERGTLSDDKLFQWFRLAFPDGIEGWIRDDLLEITGDCTAFGYGILTTEMRAFGMLRHESAEPEPEPKQRKQTPPDPQTKPRPRPADTPERVRLAAFNITAGFEGGGFDTFQNNDSGIVSFGRFQFTLASGNLFAVVEDYVNNSSSDVAAQLRTNYLDRLRNLDLALRDDNRLRDLLIGSAGEAAMQDAQNRRATENFWQRVIELSVEPRGILTPLGKALVFDMSIQHGLMHDLLNVAEEKLNIPLREPFGNFGVTEATFIAEVALARRDRLHNLARARNLPGLIPRGDFWVEIVQDGDWDLGGDDNGEIEIKDGRRVQARNP